MMKSGKDFLFLNFLAATLFLGFSRLAHAQIDEFAIEQAPPSSVGRVTTVVSKTKHVVVQFAKNDFQVGDSMTVTSEEGPTCEGTIIKKSGNRGVLDLSSCADFHAMALGQHVNRNGATSSEGARKRGSGSSNASSNSGFWHQLRYGVGIYYSFASEIDFNNANLAGTSTTVDANTSGEPGLKFSVGWLPSQSWGLDAALAYEFSRSITTAKVGSQTDDLSSLGLKVAFVNIELGGHYSFSHIYVPAALLIDVATGSGQSGWSSATPGIGVQGGLGYQFDQHFAIEALYKMESFTVPSSTTNLLTTNYGTGYLYNFQLGGTYWF